MFTLIWTFGFILGGAPQVHKMPEPMEPMEYEICRGVITQNVERMHDWLRGTLRQPLNFPVAVYGEREPVLRDAAKRGD